MLVPSGRRGRSISTDEPTLDPPKVGSFVSLGQVERGILWGEYPLVLHEVCGEVSREYLPIRQPEGQAKGLG